MKRFHLLLLLISSLQACGQHTSLEDFFDQKAKRGDFNGVVLIAQKNQILLRKAYGFKDFEKKTQNTPSTQFRIGSLTKQFVAAMILLLESEGKINTHAKISHFWPDYPNGDKITIDHLVHHTSGIPNFLFFADYRTFMNTPHTTAQMVARFKDLPLEFLPGTSYNYSNSGYYLLGGIIEKVTQMRLEMALKKYIFDKISLPHTGLLMPPEQLATGHTRAAWGLAKADAIHMTVPFAAGAMYSTVDDLYQWHQAIRGTFLTEAQKMKQTQPQLENYGYGLWIDNSLNKRRIWHTGGINGFRAVMSYYPESDTYIVALCNIEKVDIEAFEKEIATQIFK